MKPNKVLIIPNPDKEAAMAATDKIVNLLIQWGCAAISSEPDLSIGDNVQKSSPDLIVVLGGDGTIINVARQTAGMDVPIVGVNFGTLGYMAEIQPDKLDDLKKILEGNYTVQKRMMLDVTVIKPDGRAISSEHPALNDAVLSNGPIPKLLEFEIYANSCLTHIMRSDGIVISTPTGSSAYSMSAGGPIMDPELNCICTTPICPHNLSNSRPTIFTSTTVLEIRNCKCRSNSIYLSVDGREFFEIEEDDIIHISRSTYNVPLVRLGSGSFVRVLDRRLHHHNSK